MHETIGDQGRTKEETGAAIGGGPGGGHASRALAFARRHPALTVAGAAGAVLIGGLELAAGVLLGAGIAAYVRARGERTPATETHASRGRVRGTIARLAPEVRRRARAVIQAARGELAPDGAARACDDRAVR